MAEVGIIIRTRDRPVTLPRALASVKNQSFVDWQVAIVNDGGDREALEALVREHLPDASDRVRLVHHETSRGRWPAANAGVKALDCRYLVIHDDDDSWQPQFLARTVTELSGADEGIGGVLTRIVEITEKIVDGKPVTRRRRPFRPGLQAITIGEMARRNQVSTIAFLYRRDLHDRVGMYDETLPVLGDWEFYLRVLRHYDIRLIDEPLANYHKRHGASDDAYANTVIGGISQHYETDARIRNRLFRQDLEAGVVGIGTLATLGRRGGTMDDLAQEMVRRLVPFLRPWKLFSRYSR